MPLKETEYIDYQCLEGASWQLFGDYTQDEFAAEGTTIVSGKLRVQCLLGGNMATVTKWPPCRNTAVKKCNVNGTSPMLPASTGLRKVGCGPVVSIIFAAYFCRGVIIIGTNICHWSTVINIIQ